MKVTLANLAHRRRRGWTVFTAPKELAAAFGTEATLELSNGKTLRVVRGRTVGARTVFRVHAQLRGLESVTGNLLNEAHQEGLSQPVFTPHPWAIDDLAALFPSFGARVDGRDYWDQPLGSPTLIDASPAHQRWWIRRWIPELGLIMEWWGDLLHDDPVIQISGKIVWSNRGDPNSNKRFDFIAIRAGEYIALDFEKRHGVLPGIQVDGLWGRVLFSSPIVLNDGSGIPLSGFMLTNPRASDDRAVDWDSLFAANEAPTYGVCHDWNGYWGANRNTPRIRNGKPQADQDWASFANMLQVRDHYFSTRPLGSNRDPSGTGDQEDFGACKGTWAVSLHDPRFIHAYKYSVQAELFRGYNHYEGSGDKLRAQTHPQWVTWSTATHYSTNVSPDRLGKAPQMWSPPGTGFIGHDDQHYSYNNLVAYALLTDDPWVDDLLAHRAEVDLASYWNRFGGIDATRGHGRTIGAWAHFVTLCDGPLREKWIQLIKRRIESSQTNNLNVSGPMKVWTQHEPDGRKPVFNSDNSLGRWTSFWELGLALVGLYNAHKVAPSPELLRLLRTLSNTMLSFGFFKENGQWYTVADSLWKSGAAVNLATNSREITWDRGGGVTSWTFAGILVAKELLGESHPRNAEAAEYISSMTGNLEAADRKSAEWRACVAN